MRRALAIPKDQLPRVPKHRPADQRQRRRGRSAQGAPEDDQREPRRRLEGHRDRRRPRGDRRRRRRRRAGPHGWRRELFGETALKLKRGEIALAVKQNHVVAIDAPSTTYSTTIAGFQSRRVLASWPRRRSTRAPPSGAEIRRQHQRQLLAARLDPRAPDDAGHGAGDQMGDAQRGAEGAGALHQAGRGKFADARRQCSSISPSCR